VKENNPPLDFVGKTNSLVCKVTLFFLESPSKILSASFLPLSMIFGIQRADTCGIITWFLNLTK